MLDTTRFTIPLMMLIAVSAGAGGVYYQYQFKAGDMHQTIVMRSTSAPQLIPTIMPTMSPPVAKETRLAAQVQGTSDAHATSPFRPLPQSSPTPAAEAANTTSSSVAFIDLPSTVKTGEKFTVRWAITGPKGAQGEDTKLTVAYHVKSDEGSSHSSVNSNTSTSFGSFTVPKTFSSTFTFGQHPGPVVLTVTAQVAGQEVRSERTIALTE